MHSVPHDCYSATACASRVTSTRLEQPNTLGNYFNVLRPWTTCADYSISLASCIVDVDWITVCGVVAVAPSFHTGLSSLLNEASLSNALNI